MRVSSVGSELCSDSGTGLNLTLGLRLRVGLLGLAVSAPAPGPNRTIAQGSRFVLQLSRSVLHFRYR